MKNWHVKCCLLLLFGLMLIACERQIDVNHDQIPALDLVDDEEMIELELCV